LLPGIKGILQNKQMRSGIPGLQGRATCMRCGDGSTTISVIHMKQQETNETLLGVDGHLPSATADTLLNRTWHPDLF
jgi:hypothetical protein